MKRSGILFSVSVFFLAFFLVNVTAQTFSCSDTQTIVRLASQTNSHAELVNGGGGYPVRICYSEIFGTSAPAVATRPTSGSSGIVLKLSSPTNAHAEGPSGGIYSNNVYFSTANGPLSCRIVLSTLAKNSNECEVVSLSAQTNSHVAVPGSYSGAGNYKILCSIPGYNSPTCGGIVSGPTCSDGIQNQGETGIDCGGPCPACPTGGLPSIYNYKWANSDQSQYGITTAQVGETVRIVVDGQNMIVGSTVTIQVYEVSSPGTTLATFQHQVVISNGLYGSNDQWTPTTGGQYKFRVTYSTGTGNAQVTSTTLSVQQPAIAAKQWRNQAGSTIITEAYGGQTVELRALTTAIADGTQVTFTIKKSAGGTVTTLTAPVSGGVAKTTWTIGQSIATYPFGLYFEATSSAASDTSNAPVLTVNDPSLIQPIANITGIKHKGIYFVGTILNFSQDLGVAVPGNYKYLWKIDEDNYENDSFQFNYTLSSAGQKTVTLQVKDTSGNVLDEQQIAILALASPGILAFIDKPKHLQVIPDPGNNILKVDYSANDSYVVFAGTGNCPPLTCLAGYCPAMTENAKSICAPQTKLPVSSNNIGFNDNFTFTWTINGNQFSKVGAAGVGATANYGNRIRSNNGRETINLLLHFNNGSIDLTKSVSRLFTTGQCVGNGATWVQINPITGKELIRLSTATSGVACAGLDGLANNITDCCPTGSVCTTNGCVNVHDDTLPTGCAYYQDETSCNNDAEGQARVDVLASQPPTCDDPNVICSCFWNETASTTNKCGLNKTILNPNTFDTNYSCSLNYDQSQCNNGYATVNVQAIFDAGSSGQSAAAVSCVDDQFQALCGRPTFELPFFDARNFVAAALGIALIYFVGSRFKKRKVS